MTRPSSRNASSYQLLHDPRFNKGTAFTEIGFRDDLTNNWLLR
jgi:hypothetical protein